MQIELPKELYLSYVKHRKADLKLLEEALEKNKVDEFRRVGHQIRGNAVSFGFQELESLGDRLEALDMHSVITSGPDLLQELRNWILVTEKKLAATE